MTTSTKSEDVEALAHRADVLGISINGSRHQTLADHHSDVASTLRALLAERDALQEEVNRLRELIDNPNQSDAKQKRYHYDWDRVDAALNASTEEKGEA